MMISERKIFSLTAVSVDFFLSVSILNSNELF